MLWHNQNRLVGGIGSARIAGLRATLCYRAGYVGKPSVAAHLKIEGAAHS